MPTLHPFEQRLADRFPPSHWSASGVLTAFSAGPDSTALLAALTVLQGETARTRVVAAHFNHGLRGVESEADAAHAVAIARGLGAECVVERGAVAAAAAEQGDGIEAAAREARYHFLTATATRLGLRHIATGHTLDDQAETVLHRLLRGTGPLGLGGIPRARPLADGAVGLVRPLLGVRRADVLAYLRDRGLSFRTDASNDDVRFTRNRIRRELLPQLTRDYNPQLVEALARLAAQADELRDVVAGLVEPLVAESVRRADAGRIEIDCRALNAAPRHLVREVVRDAWRRAGWPQQAMGYAEWDVVAELIATPSAPAVTLPGGRSARRADGRLVIDA